jgi:hypothetical protein
LLYFEDEKYSILLAMFTLAGRGKTLNRTDMSSEVLSNFLIKIKQGYLKATGCGFLHSLDMNCRVHLSQ